MYDLFSPLRESTSSKVESTNSMDDTTIQLERIVTDCFV